MLKKKAKTNKRKVSASYQRKRLKKKFQTMSIKLTWQALYHLKVQEHNKCYRNDFQAC
jgi:hypothetical protein